MTNFLFIVADDLGYADLGCYGGRRPISPNLDALAAGGLRFVNGYSNSPVCSPTRFALMTGRYQYRVRGASEEPLAGNARNNPALGLPPDVPTLPSMLRDIGYRTALIGKWHLGYPPHFGPLKSGYDEHFGPMSGGVSYFRHRDRAGNTDLEENGQPIDCGGQYLTDLISTRAADWVRARAGEDKPWLLSLHYTAPHWPWETRSQGDSTPEALDNIAHLDGGNVETYQQMILEMDEGIGAVIQGLRETGQLDDTLIVFTSDNGGERFSDNWPLVGGKMDLKEGGIRVPYIVHWPAGITARGAVSQQHCLTMDWTVTMLTQAGVAAPADHAFDGISLLANLRDPGHQIDRPMFWRMKHLSQQAARIGDWKYLKIDEHEYLFNLANDARERANRAKREPQRLTQLKAAYEGWAATMPPVPLDARVSLVYGLADMPSR